MQIYPGPKFLFIQLSLQLKSLHEKLIGLVISKIIGFVLKFRSFIVISLLYWIYNFSFSLPLFLSFLNNSVQSQRECKVDFCGGEGGRSRGGLEQRFRSQTGRGGTSVDMGYPGGAWSLNRMTRASTQCDTPVTGYGTLSGGGPGIPVGGDWPSAGFESPTIWEVQSRGGTSWHGKAEPEQSKQGIHREGRPVRGCQSPSGVKGFWLQDGRL